jgi:thymidylate synthase
MKVWHDILNKVLTTGEPRQDRTGTGTLAIFGEMLEFDNEDTFPAVTTKKLAFKPMAGELAGFLIGADSLKQFHDFGCRIWDANGTADYWINNPNNKNPGDYLGRIYGVQWKDWKSVRVDKEGVLTINSLDQISALIAAVKKEPHGRRHVVTTINPGEFDQGVLPPCHIGFQVFVRNCTHLDLNVQMRSVDLFLGLPFDVASFALLQRLIAKEVGLRSGKLKFMLGDAHIYKNHIEQVKIVLSRIPLNAPKIEIEETASVFGFHPDQLRLIDYENYGVVQAPMSV